MKVFTGGDWGVQARHLAWVEGFTRAHGRSPRVLGIGNIANNGFRNAVALRNHGVECDVLSYNYYHIMGCPEWEEVDFDATGLDDFKPDWSQVDLGDYQRPRWFAQGHLGTCLDYLIALRERSEVAEELWSKLVAERDSGGGGTPTAIYAEPAPLEEIEILTRRIAQRFADVFPRRRDRLLESELRSAFGFVLQELSRFKRLLAHYDVIVGYSTDGLIPLLADKENYIAYEHGTIRAIPFQRDVQGRMCALTYAMARNVLITNCDNIVAATRLKLPRFSFTPHAILETWAGDAVSTGLRDDLLAQHDADFLVFHPSRHHWGPERDPNYDKGNDIILHAFARFVKEQRPRAHLLLVEWGQRIAETRELIETLGIAHRVAWFRPMPIRVMKKYIAASDVLADQFTIGGFGGIMPIGLLVGTPNLIYINEDFHRWCFPEMPPVLNGRTADSVFERLVEVQDKQRARVLAEAGQKWYKAYHSTSVVAGRLLDAVIPVADEDEFALDMEAAQARHVTRGLTSQLQSLEVRRQRDCEVLCSRLEHMAQLATQERQRSSQAHQHATDQTSELSRQISQLSHSVGSLAHRVNSCQHDILPVRQYIDLLEQRYVRLRKLFSPLIWSARTAKRLFGARRSSAV